MNDDLLVLFRQTGALLDGHFILRSGLHSRQFFSAPFSSRIPRWRRGFVDNWPTNRAIWPATP